MKFVDRFNRKFLDIMYVEMFNHVSMLYEERKGPYFNRSKLPSIISFDGTVVWVNINKECHCTTGPSKSKIDGYLEYRLNGRKITLLEFNTHVIS